MNKEIIKEISINLDIEEKQALVTLELLEEGNTIPFIARYRKEKTGNLTEEQIKAIADVYEYQVNLLKERNFNSVAELIFFEKLNYCDIIMKLKNYLGVKINENV